ncbi:MAG: alpha/beta hydrolase [Pirellulaceae bacterium]
MRFQNCCPRTFILVAIMSMVGLIVDTAVAQKRQAGDLTITETRSFQATDGTEVEADLGRLVVREHRANPDSPLIELAFVRLKSSSDSPGPPLIYLAGGPGGSSTGMARDEGALQGWRPVLGLCDVILLDQRGTGSSEPDLNWFIRKPFPDDFLIRRESAVQFAVEQAREAAAHFREQGRDLNGFTTLEAAHDINDLRKALDLEKVSLFGFSYGTHLALTMIKYHGETLENVIMVGVEGLDETYKLPLNMDTQLRKLAIMVSQDERVAPFVPDLVALYQRVAEKLEASPMPVTIRFRGNSQEVLVGRFGLDMILRMDLGDASDLPVFPRLLYSIDQGDSTILRAFLQKRIPMFGRLNAMSSITDGASGASVGRRQLIREQQQQTMFSNVVNMLHPEMPEAFGAPDLGEEFRRPLVSDVRTLMATGSLDYNTPPYQAERVRFGLSNATHLTVENAGHEQVIPQPQIQQAFVRFLQGEDVSDVRVALPPIRFVPIDEYDPDVTHWSVPRER